MGDQRNRQSTSVHLYDIAVHITIINFWFSTPLGSACESQTLQCTAWIYIAKMKKAAMHGLDIANSFILHWTATTPVAKPPQTSRSSCASGFGSYYVMYQPCAICSSSSESITCWCIPSHDRYSRVTPVLEISCKRAATRKKNRLSITRHAIFQVRTATVFSRV